MNRASDNKKLTLNPLTFKEAVSDLLKIKPEPKKPKKKKSKSRKVS